MRPRPRSHSRCPWLVSLALLAALGCEEPRHVGRPKTAAPTPPPAVENVPPPEPPRGEILGKRTQDIRQATPELEKGTVAASTRITAKDPITLGGNAYVTMIGRTSILKIEHAMNLYKGANDRYPANYEEFMTEIIKANGIALPQLPPYQDYAYDEKEHKLIIREYPDRKAQAHPGEN